MDWVKLDPIQLGKWIAPFRKNREIGEFFVGFQSGCLGAILRVGATKPEISGHEAGFSLLVSKNEDKELNRLKKSEAGKIGNAKRWGDRKPPEDPSLCDTSATRKGVAQRAFRDSQNDRTGVARGEERREEQQHPSGDVVVLRSEEQQKNQAEHPISVILESLVSKRREESPGWIDAMDREKRMRLGNLRLDLVAAQKILRMAEDDLDADAGKALRDVNGIRAEIMFMGSDPDA
jgi:hypothetical protein